MWIVVGLGNPGGRYERTRHNVGFRVLDRLAARWGLAGERNAHQALIAQARQGGERVLLVKPQTFMNASGKSVASVRRFYRPPPGRLIVVHDDVDLPAGRVRIRGSGRAGGNRGVESLLAVLGDEPFVRVKVGVGRPPGGPVPVDHVLGVPGGDEAARLAEAEERAALAVELVVVEGAQRAMNRINQKEAVHGGPPL